METPTDIWTQAAEKAWLVVLADVTKLKNEGQTLEGIAKLLGVKSRAHIGEWLNGNRTAVNSPFPSMLRYLAVLGHNPRDFVPSSTGEMPEPAPKAQAPAPTCATCKKLLAKDKEIQKLQKELDKMRLELAGAQGEVRALERQIDRHSDAGRQAETPAERKAAG